MCRKSGRILYASANWVEPAYARTAVWPMALEVGTCPEMEHSLALCELATFQALPAFPAIDTPGPKRHAARPRPIDACGQDLPQPDSGAATLCLRRGRLSGWPNRLLAPASRFFAGGADVVYDPLENRAIAYSSRAPGTRTIVTCRFPKALDSLSSIFGCLPVI